MINLFFGQIEMIGHARAAALEYAPPSVKQQIDRGFNMLVRHSAAYQRNIQSILQAGQQLADAYGRIRDVCEQNEAHMQALVGLCGGHYPEVAQVVDVVRQDQRQVAETAMRDIASKLLDAGYMDADEAGRRLFERYL